MGQQVPELKGKILRLSFYFTALPKGQETDGIESVLT